MWGLTWVQEMLRFLWFLEGGPKVKRRRVSAVFKLFSLESPNMDFFTSQPFMPHGHCYLWRPDTLWLNVGSDVLTSLAYFTIPFLIVYFVHKRKRNLPSNWISLMFAAFIVTCGVSHVMSIVTVWIPLYNLEGLSKLLTAILAIATAIAMWKLMPQMIQVPSFEELEEIKRYEEQLREALSARDSFIAVASHELKTPLTSLTLLVGISKNRILKKDLAFFEPEQISKVVLELDRQIARLSALMKNMLDVSYLSAGQFGIVPERVDLSELISVAFDRFQDQCKQAGNLCTKHLQAGIYAMVDPLRIEQVINNLMNNALKYGDKKPIDVYLSRKNSDAVIVVQDQGRGMTEEACGKIFTKFARATKAKDGLGLGLFISKEIVVAHGGTISVQSKVNEGSIFTVIIPLVCRIE